MNSQNLVAAQLLSTSLFAVLFVFSVVSLKKKYSSSFWTAAEKVTSHSAFYALLSTVATLAAALNYSNKVGSAIWHSCLNLHDSGAVVLANVMGVSWAISYAAVVVFAGVSAFVVAQAELIRMQESNKNRKAKAYLVG